MKYSYLLIIFLCLGLVLYSCGKDENEPENTENALESTDEPTETPADEPEKVEDNWFEAKVNLEEVSGLEGKDLEKTEQMLDLIRKIEGLPKTYDRSKEQPLIEKYQENPVKYCEAYRKIMILNKEIKHGFVHDMMKNPLRNFRLVLSEASLKYMYLPITKTNKVEETYLYLNAMEMIKNNKIKEAFDSIGFSEDGEQGYPVLFLYPRLGSAELDEIDSKIDTLKKKFNEELFPIYKTLLVYPTLVHLFELKIIELSKDKKYKQMFELLDNLPDEIQDIFKSLPEKEFKSAVTKFNSKFIQKHIKELYKPMMNKLWDIMDKYFYKTNIEISDEKLDEIGEELTAVEDEIKSWDLAEFAVENENTINSKIREMRSIIDKKRKENAE